MSPNASMHPGRSPRESRPPGFPHLPYHEPSKKLFQHNIQFISYAVSPLKCPRLGARPGPLARCHFGRDSITAFIFPDRKRLRLTCKVLSDVTPLRLSRVFLSPNPLDIEVFHAIADHPQFRHQIKEIIWDDARFVSTPSLLDEYWWEVIEGGF